MIIGACLEEKSLDPIKIMEKMMGMPFCHMHGPEHHVMVGAALLTAYKNAGGEIELEKALSEMMSRGKSVPGGACGFWGACGAGISAGMFMSVITGSTPLREEPFALSHRMTASALTAIADVGGPRCCKRNAFLAMKTVISYVKEKYRIQLEDSDIVCSFSPLNQQCLRERCPFYRRTSFEIRDCDDCDMTLGIHPEL